MRLGMYIYKVISSDSGLEELEKKVSESINKGWKPQGGIAFSHGYSYQAMIGKKKIPKKKEISETIEEESKSNTANQAMKRLDELT